jgi:hypothetical protein
MCADLSAGDRQLNWDFLGNCTGFTCLQGSSLSSIWFYWITRTANDFSPFEHMGKVFIMSACVVTMRWSSCADGLAGLVGEAARIFYVCWSKCTGDYQLNRDLLGICTGFTFFREVLLALSGSIGSLERKVTSLCLDRWVTHSYIFIHEFSFPSFVYLLISFACTSLICSSLQINKISMIESVPDWTWQIYLVSGMVLSSVGQLFDVLITVMWPMPQFFQNLEIRGQ